MATLTFWSYSQYFEVWPSFQYLSQAHAIVYRPFPMLNPLCFRRCRDAMVIIEEGQNVSKLHQPYSAHSACFQWRWGGHHSKDWRARINFRVCYLSNLVPLGGRALYGCERHRVVFETCRLWGVPRDRQVLAFWAVGPYRRRLQDVYASPYPRSGAAEGATMAFAVGCDPVSF